MDYSLLEVAKRIIDEHPGSFLARESDGAAQAVSLKNCLDYYYYDALNWCGCGQPETALKAIKDYLSCVKFVHAKPEVPVSERAKIVPSGYMDESGYPDIYKNPLLLCLAYAMDAAEFTDHGGGIGSAWLTTEGEMFLWVLENIDLDEINDPG